MRALARATAVTVPPGLLTSDRDDSSVNTTTERSGCQVSSGAGARNDLATWYSSSLAAAARMKPPTTSSGLEPGATGLASTRTSFSCTDPTSRPGCTDDVVDSPP